MDNSDGFSLKSDTTLARIQEMTKKRTGSVTDVAYISLTFLCLCIQEGFCGWEENNWILAISLTISISAKWLGLSGARLVVSDMVNQKFSAVFPYFD